MLSYPAIIEPDGAGYLVRFPDIPEALTQGDTREEAIAMAADALLTAMDFYVEDRRPVPQPSKLKKGQVAVALPASVAAKVMVLNAMIRADVTPAELARRMRISPQVVTRIVDLGHATKIDTLDAALHAVGCRLELTTRPVASPKTAAGRRHG